MKAGTSDGDKDARVSVWGESVFTGVLGTPEKKAAAANYELKGSLRNKERKTGNLCAKRPSVQTGERGRRSRRETPIGRAMAKTNPRLPIGKGAL